MKKIIEKFKNMRKAKKQSLLFGFAILVLACVIGITIYSSIDFVEYADYEDPKTGVKMKYPAGWIVLPQPPEGILAIFLSPKEGSLDNFQENVNIVIIDLSATPMTFDEFTRKNIKQVTFTFDTFIKVVESKPFNFAGQKGYRFSYIGDREDVPNPLRYMHVWCLEKNRAYIITYSGLKSDYDKYIKMVNAMIKSFRVN